MHWGDLLVEAKLTESDFQCREAHIVEAYRDLDEVFDRDLLPRVQMRTRRRREAVELVEEFTQEWEPPCENSEEVARAFHAEIEARADAEQPWQPGYASYQLIRNVLAAYAGTSSFLRDSRRAPARPARILVSGYDRHQERRYARPLQGPHLAGSRSSPARTTARFSRREIRHRRTRAHPVRPWRNSKLGLMTRAKGHEKIAK